MQAIAMSATYAAGADGTQETLAKITVEEHPQGHAIILEGTAGQHVWIYTTGRQIAMRDYRRAVLTAAKDPQCLHRGRTRVWDTTDVAMAASIRHNPYLHF